MKTTIILGNGFDLNLGLSTSYKDFYEHYCPKGQTIFGSEPVSKLKRNLSNSKEVFSTWSNFELSLGGFTENLVKEDELEKVYDDLVDVLGRFIADKELQFDYKQIDKTHLIECFKAPENYLQGTQIERVKGLRRTYNQEDRSLEIISLNYTRTIEKILGNSFPVSLGSSLQLDNVHHVHGMTDQRMVLGVNDVKQIKNKNFQQSENIRSFFIKDEYNKVLEHGVEQVCKNLIDHSNLMCIYGCSLGETDAVWWNQIAHRLLKSDDALLIVFMKSTNILDNNPRMTGPEKRKVVDKILNDIELSPENKQQVSDRILVRFNSDIFNLQNKKKKQELHTSLPELGVINQGQMHI